MQELKLEILRKLEFGFKVDYRKFNCERAIFNEMVRELANEGYVTYTPETNERFKDDVNNVRITEKGKEFIKSLS